MLVPGAMLEVVGLLSQGDLTMVQLSEIDAPLAFNEFPHKGVGLKSTQVNGVSF